jgi:hypothetical protein
MQEADHVAPLLFPIQNLWTIELDLRRLTDRASELSRIPNAAPVIADESPAMLDRRR